MSIDIDVQDMIARHGSEITTIYDIAFFCGMSGTPFDVREVPIENREELVLMLNDLKSKTIKLLPETEVQDYIGKFDSNIQLDVIGELPSNKTIFENIIHGTLYEKSHGAKLVARALEDWDPEQTELDRPKGYNHNGVIYDVDYGFMTNLDGSDAEGVDFYLMPGHELANSHPLYWLANNTGEVKLVVGERDDKEAAEECRAMSEKVHAHFGSTYKPKLNAIEIEKHLPGRHNQKEHAGDDNVSEADNPDLEQFRRDALEFFSKNKKRILKDIDDSRVVDIDIYGSVTDRNKFSENSDVDLALLIDPKVSEDEYEAIARKFDGKLFAGDAGVYNVVPVKLSKGKVKKSEVDADLFIQKIDEMVSRIETALQQKAIAEEPVIVGADSMMEYEEEDVKKADVEAIVKSVVTDVMSQMRPQEVPRGIGEETILKMVDKFTDRMDVERRHGENKSISMMEMEQAISLINTSLAARPQVPAVMMAPPYSYSPMLGETSELKSETDEPKVDFNQLLAEGINKIAEALAIQKAPTVNVDIQPTPVQITNEVQVPEYKSGPAPIIQVNPTPIQITNEVDVPPADVKVSIEAEVKMPEGREVTKVTKRDRAGRIDETEKEWKK